MLHAPLIIVLLTTPAEPAVDAAIPTTAEEGQSAPRLRLGARLHARYQLDQGDSVHHFDIRRARFAVKLDPTPWLEAQIDVDVADAPALEDGFVELKLAPWLSITAGQFKKPFSRLRLTGPRKLPLWERGIVIDRIVGSLGFGGRDLGMMASGRAGGLRYAAGLFNGNGELSEIDSGKDAVARLRYRFSPSFELGTSASMRYRNAQDVDWPRRDVWAAGLDSRLRLKPVQVVTEVLWGQNGARADVPQSLGAIAYAVVRFDLSDELSLRPLLKAELLDDDLANNHDLSWSMTAGINLHVNGLLRIMVQAEQIDCQVRSTTRAERRVVVQLALDYLLDVTRALQGDAG